MAGRLIGVVGPSGVGKDSVMQAVAARRPGTVLVRRVITRDGAAGGEVFDSVSRSEFLAREAAGAFLLSWQAHGLHYGIPDDVGDALAAGQDALVNLSRGVLGLARARVPGFLCLRLSAPVPVLAARLAARGREDAGDIARRLARADFALPPGIPATEVDNSGPLDATVARVLALLEDMPAQ
ncbi:phosphonate metabolism protein/1,5-bisphosphokinase (PRPP-forming) PhnN [Pseudooceanicola sp. CBS1P-1]|uniref:Ribose 1,5-bisphosphate phosphokinase PhnN n=1 Tax=Pseudooceanicola albus TaxID=2692189 RepID=A0A6L7G072_9RHOB|nr:MULTISPECIES: phosphonate metabolism protein/1,5-bisphosphokinase (PRPP-forming) PhnN [Pseudooceanicola]MBT9382346.1 phosphonate metabolism protein/1,5-bisphosphokinase (PRPP-forming) PhnN [Pseudooceanicola endophyticus]MXN16888.1 phosphonate metabolism protein/1,5-bisphosphokinase (PRPP-forming) PhnN [Pseudooceanicola albus]